MADVVALFRVLSDANRIKIAAAIMDQALSVDQIAAAVELPSRAVWGHIGAFQMMGLVEERPAGTVSRRALRLTPSRAIAREAGLAVQGS